MWKRIVLTFVLMLTLAAQCPVQGCGAAGGSAADGSKLVGDWTGESLCAGDNPSCHDEKVVYHITKPPDASGALTIAADKIVNGKPEPMGEIELKYDAEKGTLVGDLKNSRYRGVWEFTVRDDVMEGTLTMLPGQTVARRIKVRKVV
ncbi:MAG TPA: hypothetical protein VHU19_12340 [Pyrinomonadaceae bacterium]|jgi:hypothetical protein|nr:hypothetical protein [Pyrinomonadaceae bacterium]